MFLQHLWMFSGVSALRGKNPVPPRRHGIARCAGLIRLFVGCLVEGYGAFVRLSFCGFYERVGEVGSFAACVVSVRRSDWLLCTVRHLLFRNTIAVWLRFIVGVLCLVIFRAKYFKL